MTTLTPRPPYSEEELSRLYPSHLRLEQVQILLRHGERTPVSARFQASGLHGSWPYCRAANELKSAVFAADGACDTLSWQRRLETLGKNDAPHLAVGPGGEVDAICQPGELTDRGRETTLSLGQRLRTLYIHQLALLPPFLSQSTQSTIHLRATPIQRALESVQQTYVGLYPPASRSPALPPTPIIQRSITDETLFPNERGCPRFAELAHAFANRAAERWNGSEEMKMLNKRLGKHMPPATPEVKVDGHPRLSGIMDSINATLAHGPATRLPSEFYEQQVRDTIDKICVEEWFGGYEESLEYRKLGIGGLVGDLTQRMVEHVTAKDEEEKWKMSLSGCHDTTIAATLTALGGFRTKSDKWPNFTSSIAFELFARKEDTGATAGKKGWFAKKGSSDPRAKWEDMSQEQRERLQGKFVRIRYNDKVVTLPGCKGEGRHLEGDESFCTLEAFKQVADRFTPQDWRGECRTGLGTSAFGQVEMPVGVVEQ
ncbi:related to acid phosphatase [Ramularia collo-cygni]|uniref:3-phytase n=1 Tax=Ramularia collo-cygni TaxID=112498 RepID=A0A2D3V8K6_9PEZI|nr:related to acid phosphatase [Ramularia collo-cygni]CZT18924.1 related to acid phosphatase [Ramularia collo-cygni]